MIRRCIAYLDLGFFSACNLKCSYCRDGLINSKSSVTIAELKQQLQQWLKFFRPAVLKMSGYGEITLWKDFEESIHYSSELFPVIQVITNGLFSDRVLDAMVAMENLSPNLTIDGHEMEMNKYRVEGNVKFHNRMLENLEKLIAKGKRVEVNMVLHDDNIHDVYKFSTYLNAYPPGSVMLFPFPVKKFDKSSTEASHFSSTSFTAAIDGIRSAYQDFPHLFAASKYIDGLVTFYAGKRLVPNCYVHWANVGTGSQNKRLHCANYGENLTYGDLPQHCSDDDKHGLQLAHLKDGAVGPNCDICYNHFHILNYFLRGEISLEQMVNVPSLDFQGVTPILKQLKADFRSLM